MGEGETSFQSLVDQIKNGDYFSYREKLNNFKNIDYQIYFFLFNDVQSSHFSISF